MSNEDNIEDIDLEIDEDDVDDTPDVDEDDDQIDWKAEALKAQGMAKRYKTKLEKKEQEKNDKPAKKEKETTLDYGQKAYLIANGIKGKKENDLVKEYLASGKELEDIIESKHFQNDLKDLREEMETDRAVPRGPKRSGSSARDSVEYWIAKGELPPKDQVELRRKVVNAKAGKGGASSPFYNS